MSIKRTLILSVTSLIVLSGCEGYEMVKTNTMFPYGNQRTAGSGVAYVLAKMMPEKELKLEPVEKNIERDWKPAVIETLPEPEPVPAVPPQRAEEIFRDQTQK